MTFDDFFRAATRNAPYDYQSRLAGSDNGCACESQLIAIPTGLGETDGSPSWTARVLSLRDAADLGLFRLAWLETFLRAADAIGSAQPTQAAQP